MRITVKDFKREGIGSGDFCKEGITFTHPDFPNVMIWEHPYPFVDKSLDILTVSSGKLNNRAVLDVDDDTIINMDDDKVELKCNGRTLGFNTGRDLTEKGFVGNLSSFLEDVIERNYPDPDDREIPLCFIHRGNEEMYQGAFVDCWSDDYAEGIRKLLDCQVKSYHIHEGKYGSTIYDIHLFEEPSEEDLVEALSFSLKDFVRECFKEEEDGVYEGDKYPFLKAYKKDKGYRIEFSYIGDYVEGFGDDGVFVVEGELQLFTGPYHYQIFFEGNPFIRLKDANQKKLRNLLEELALEMKK